MSKRTNRTRRRPRELAFGGDPGVGIPAVGINVLGNPFAGTGEPVFREATLDDVEDDCPLCQELRRQIQSGNPPQIMVFE